MSQPTIELLRRMREGDSDASEQLMMLVYRQLHQIALQRLRKERPNHTLQPTALVGEACLRLFDFPRLEFTDRSHFLAVASRIMRQVLVDYARSRGAAKRGGPNADNVETVSNLAAEADGDTVALLDLDAAITSLAQEHPTAAQSVELLYFAGMTAEETAEATGRSAHIIRHELRYARAWIKRRMQTE